MTTQGRGTRPLKEAFFVQVMTSDDTLIFFDETSNLGRKMPYDKPEATCSMRASANTVAFTLKKFTNRSRAEAVERRLELPRGPLDRSERLAESLGKDLGPDVLVVEIEKVIHQLGIKRDENGVATLETLGEGDDAQFELPRGSVRATFVLRSPRGSKTVSASFEGHLGKPGSPETVTRVAAMALNVLAGLATFRMAAGIETVQVPSSPARFIAARPAIKAADRARITIPVRLWSDGDNPAPLGQTDVTIELDLETANPVSGRLLFHLSVPDDAAEAFKPYRTLVSEAALTAVTNALGPDEVNELVYSIALGELGSGDLERLRDAVATIPGLNVNPRQWAPIVPTPAAA